MIYTTDSLKRKKFEFIVEDYCSPKFPTTIQCDEGLNGPKSLVKVL